MKTSTLRKSLLSAAALSALLVTSAYAEEIPVTAASTESTSTSTSTSNDTASNDQTETSPNLDGSLNSFPTRSVVLINQNTGKNSAFEQYMMTQLNNVFRYPYYQTTERTIDHAITASDLANMAQEDKSNGLDYSLYLSPYAKTDEYGSGRQGGFTGIFRKNMSDSDYKHTSVEGTLYYYDTQNKQAGTITKGFYGTEDALSMPSHQGVYKDVVDRMLQQLPYKRIPTDGTAYSPSTDIGTNTSTSTTGKTPTSLSDFKDLLKDPKNIDVDQLLNSLLQKQSASSTLNMGTKKNGFDWTQLLGRI